MHCNTRNIKLGLIASISLLLVILASKYHIVLLGFYDDAIIDEFVQGKLFHHAFLSAPGSDKAFINFSLFRSAFFLSQLFGRSGYEIILVIADTVILLAFIYILSDSTYRISGYPLQISASILLGLIFLPTIILFANYSSLSTLFAAIGIMLIARSGCAAMKTIGLGFLISSFFFRYQFGLASSIIILISFPGLIPAISQKFGRLHTFIGLMLILLTPLFFNSCANPTERARIESFNKYNFTANDAYLTTTNAGIANANESIMLEALCSWNIVDKNISQQSELEKITYASPFNLNALHNLPKKINLAYQSLVKYGNHTPSFNTFLSLLLLALFAIWQVFFSGNSLRNLWPYLIISAFLIAFIIFLKIEFRLINPLIFSVLLYSITFNPPDKNLKTLRSSILILLLGAFCIWANYLLYQSYTDRIHDKQYATQLVSRINKTFPGYTIVSDVNTMILPSMVTDDSACAIHWVNTGEYWIYFYEGYRDYCQKKCGSFEMNDVLSCLSGQPKILFLLSDYKVSILTRFSNCVNHQNLRFVPIQTNGCTYSTELYLLLPQKFHLNLYQLLPVENQ